MGGSLAAPCRLRRRFPPFEPEWVYRSRLVSCPDWSASFAVKVKVFRRSMRRKYFALQHQGPVNVSFRLARCSGRCSADYCEFVDRISRTAHINIAETTSAIARSPARPAHKNLGPLAYPSVCLRSKGKPYFNEQSLQSTARHHWNDCIAAKDNTVAMLNLRK
jgi:hypothetical protein